MVTFIAVFVGITLAWLSAEMGSRMEGASLTADIVRAAGRGVERFFASAMVVARAALEGMRLSLNGTWYGTTTQPLELPEWTGRERESLRADLEAATTPDYPWDSWEQIKERDASESLSGYLVNNVIESTAASHGLFPEALEVYLENQE